MSKTAAAETHGKSIRDSHFSDELLGRLFRRGITTWEELSQFSLNEIASWGHILLWQLGDIKEGLRKRGLRIVPFDAFALVSDSTRRNLASAGILSFRDLCHHSVKELRAIPRIGHKSLREIEDCVELAGLLLRPGTIPEPIPAHLQQIEELRISGFSIADIAARMGLSEGRVRTLLHKLPRRKLEAKWALEAYRRWQTQF